MALRALKLLARRTTPKRSSQKCHIFHRKTRSVADCRRHHHGAFYYRNDVGSGRTDASGGGFVGLDISVFHTYLVTLSGGLAKLHVDGNLTPVLTGTGFANPFSGIFFGFPGQYYTGTTEWDYVRWSNETSVVPVPEPSLASLLAASLGGLWAVWRCRWCKQKDRETASGMPAARH